ncbi:long-chain fatty acid--CoA ligase [Pelomyxa schiedti]|nr:long-chain fatty acid--CoA ligase [Pelomyxa schiedti]
MALHIAGLVPVGIYPSQTAEQYTHIISHSGARVVIVEGEKELQAVLSAVHNLDEVIAIITWEEDIATKYEAQDRRLYPWSQIDKPYSPLEKTRLLERLATVQREDLAILVYTSGTTGLTKGCMLSHNNILSLMQSWQEFSEVVKCQVVSDDVIFEFLPLAHVAERIIGFYWRMCSGMTGAYASSPDRVLKELNEINPTRFGCVPRVLEKAYGFIREEISKKNKIVRAMFYWAEGIGLDVVQHQQKQQPVPILLRAKYEIAYRLVLNKICKQFGTRMQTIFVGAAPVNPSILEFFIACRVPCYEIYGMTELTAACHGNYGDQNKIGTVGKAVPHCQQKLGPDGELLIKGSLVFMGYYKDEESTRAAFTDDGWFKTGDMATIDKDGFVQIIDRLKHIIITSGGKNLSPQFISETVAIQDPIISAVHPHGDKRPFVTALIAPSPLETLSLGVSLGVVNQALASQLTHEVLQNPYSRSEELDKCMSQVTKHKTFIERVQQAVQRANTHLARVESVKKVYILDRDFSQEHGELTPTMKEKRNIVEKRYAPIFDRLYTEDDFGIKT